MHKYVKKNFSRKNLKKFFQGCESTGEVCFGLRLSISKIDCSSVNPMSDSIFSYPIYYLREDPFAESRTASVIQKPAKDEESEVYKVR